MLEINQGVSLLFSREGRRQWSMWGALDGCQVCQWAGAILLGVRPGFPEPPREDPPAIHPVSLEHMPMP